MSLKQGFTNVLYRIRELLGLEKTFLHPELVSVEILPGWKLRSVFTDETVTEYNFSKLATEDPVFKPLLDDPELFKSFQTTEYAIIWNKNLDLDCCELYYGNNIVRKWSKWIEGDYPNPELVAVEAIPGWKLRSVFQDGTITEYDASELASEDLKFQALLQDPKLFRSVQFIPFGVSWNADLYLDSWELWIKGNIVARGSQWNRGREYPLPKLVSVKAISRIMLHAEFSDGTIIEYDVLELASDCREFQALLDTPKLFKSVKVKNSQAYWNEDYFLDSRELWLRGNIVEKGTQWNRGRKVLPKPGNDSL